VNLFDTKEALQGIHIGQIVLAHSSHVDQYFGVALVVEIEAEDHFISMELGDGDHQFEVLSLRFFLFLFLIFFLFLFLKNLLSVNQALRFS
jgi:hypothetical protein